MIGEIFGEQGVIVLILIVVLLFGGSQIPKLARSLGEARNEFRKADGENEKSTTTPG